MTEMKRLVPILFCIFVLLAAGCSKQESQESTPAAVETEAFGPLAVPLAHLIPYESCDKSRNYRFCFKPVHLGMVCEAPVGN